MNKSFLTIILLALVACSNPKKTTEKLPIYGNTTFTDTDTVYHTIQDFMLLDQDSALVTNETLSNKVYVADFFFTSCPTICPTMKTQMLRVYNNFETEDNLLILSHTIDPTHDTIPLLNDYAQRLGVSSKRWKFLWGTKDEIYDLAERSYLSIADEDSDAPGGYIHSGAFLLIDKQRRVRGVYDGTMPEQVDILMIDIEKLIAEYNPIKN